MTSDLAPTGEDAGGEVARLREPKARVSVAVITLHLAQYGSLAIGTRTWSQARESDLATGKIGLVDQYAERPNTKAPRTGIPTGGPKVDWHFV